MEINHWAKLVASKLVKDQIENEDTDLIIIGHYGGFATYKQDGWSGYAMRMSDFITRVSGVNTLLAGPGILVTNPTGPVTTVSWDGTQGGGTNFSIQPEGPIQVSKNSEPLDGQPINITNLDTLNISAIALPSGLNWAGSWLAGEDIGFAADDVVWYDDPVTETYYTYWAWNGIVPPNSPLPGAGVANNEFWARLGLEGPQGKTGLSTAILKMYQWSALIPTVFPITDSVYTWADGSFTAPLDAGLWSLNVPSAPIEDQILWEIEQQYVDYPTTLVTNVTWSTTVANPIAYYGAAGVDGKTVLSGSGAPNNSLGEDGDFYIDTASSNYTMYGPKIGGNWTTNPSKNLKGDAGASGSITYSGAGAPPGGTGVIGDYYIDTSSTNYTMYGPKLATGNWTGVTTLNLKGTQGAPGGAIIDVSTPIKTANYTMQATDGTKLIRFNTGASTLQITVPESLSAMPNGSQVIFAWESGAAGGILKFVQGNPGTGPTLYSANSMLFFRAIGSMATVIKISDTVYYIIGDLAPY